MIYVDMGGGRDGNQMFHYAVARYVELKNGDKDLVLDYRSIYGLHKEDEGFVESLADYKTVPYRHYYKRVPAIRNDANFVQRVIGHFKCKYMDKCRKKGGRKAAVEKDYVGQKLCNAVGIFYIEGGITKLYARKRRGNSFIRGTCEIPAIYEIQDVLQKELEPKNDVLPENMALYNDIVKSESVCVSVRRGDFWERYRDVVGVCDEKYFFDAQKAMDLKLKDKANVRYFVFSDDIGWCKENLKLHDMNFVVQDNMPKYEVMRLMYSCKHFIISNSTFSWWGQFLSQNPNKIVVSPSRWNKEGFDSVLIDKENWILIDV